jgi:hypothetical protein
VVLKIGEMVVVVVVVVALLLLLLLLLHVHNRPERDSRQIHQATLHVGR